MAQIREIKRRIKSINNTAKVTHAMELVAAAKMRKSQEKALSARPYTIALHDLLVSLKGKTVEKSHSLMATGTGEGIIVILISSDRGLVGGMNLNVARESLKLEYKGIKFITVGKKATNFAAKTGGDILASFLSDEQPFLDLARSLAKLTIDSFLSGQAGKIFVIYPKFESTVKQIPTIQQLLPIKSIDVEEEQEAQNKTADLLFEPSAEEILETILPHHVLTHIYQILLDAKASEHSARMVAMKNATDAASDLVADLTLTYNQARQEAITKELLDIVTAQSAFE
jgi:F-type H+-transporting ATPase subunit gamma